MKKIIINADDFGYSNIFNESIINLIENNLIKSTTVMVNWVNETQDEQVKRLIELKNSSNLSVGLHLEFKNHLFNIREQYENFIDIFGFKPSHLDIHKPSKSDDEYLALYNFCIENKLPCRNSGKYDSRVIMTRNSVINGTELDEINLEEFEDDNIYEILYHPGTYDKDCISTLNKDRELDVEKIKVINFKLEENEIKLISYLDLI